MPSWKKENLILPASLGSLKMPQKNQHLYANQVPSWKAWFLATRPRTLPISFVPVMVGIVFASTQVDNINWFLAVMTFLCALFIQLGTNLVNDALDFKKGIDKEGRLGPQRMTQSGLLSVKAVLNGGFLCFSLALLCGIPLIFAGGWPLSVAILLSILCGYLYTGGPYPLAYVGVSDLFVLIFFGWVSTSATYYLQTGSVNFSIFLAGTQIGLLAMVPHAINNLRDYASDARSNKKSLAVRFGPHFARIEITLLSLIPFVLGLLWIQEGNMRMALLPLAALIPILKNIRMIWETEPSPQYNHYLAKSAMCQFLFAVLLVIGKLWP